MRYKNPIIPGFYPDPSICRVGKDYYLVTSTFQYFPGIPIFHSTDLVNWEQIGHCLTRDEQLPLHKARSSGGIYAPTIRYHDGVFYVVCNNRTGGGNFIVSTDDPFGEWSDPVWVEQDGGDPSLFFDDDGTTYLTFVGIPGIYQTVIDIETGKRQSKPRHIWNGTGGRFPEGPHLYKIGEFYYLTIAEGGTEYGHMQTIARSKSPWGTFESCPHNPILTHRDRGLSPIQGTGHADFIQDPAGNWWAVFLAFRTAKGRFHHLGRETFLAAVTWNGDGWPVINGDGTVELEMETDRLDAVQGTREAFVDHFDDPKLQLCWNFLRNPSDKDWSLLERPGWLRLKGSAVTLDDVDSPAFVGRRQQHLNCRVNALLEFEPVRDGEEAGLTVFMNEKHHYDIAVTLRSGQKRVILRKRIGSLVAVVAEAPISAGPIELAIDANDDSYEFSYRANSQPFHVLGTGETRYLSSEVAGGFTGVYLAMYATGNGKPAMAKADFDWFSLFPGENQCVGKGAGTLLRGREF